MKRLSQQGCAEVSRNHFLASRQDSCLAIVEWLTQPPFLSFMSWVATRTRNRSSSSLTSEKINFFIENKLIHCHHQPVKERTNWKWRMKFTVEKTEEKEKEWKVNSNFKLLNVRYRILYLLLYGSRVGGGEIQYECLIQGLDRDRFQPIVVCPKAGDLTEAFEASGVKTHILRLPRWLQIQSFPFRSLAAKKLVQLAQQYQVDLIHSEHRMVPYLKAVSLSLEIPSVFHVRSRIRPKHFQRLFLKSASAAIVIGDRYRDSLVRAGFDSDQIHLIFYSLLGVQNGFRKRIMNPKSTKFQKMLLRSWFIGSERGCWTPREYFFWGNVASNLSPEFPRVPNLRTCCFGLDPRVIFAASPLFAKRIPGKLLLRS